MDVTERLAFYQTVTDRRIFTGPYSIKRLVEDRLEMVPNAFHPGPHAKRRVPITIVKFANGGAVATALENGEIDMGFNLPATSIQSLNWVPDVAVKSFATGYQYNMFFNTQRPYLTKAVI